MGGHLHTMSATYAGRGTHTIAHEADMFMNGGQ